MNPIRTILDKLAPIALNIQGLRLYRIAGRKFRPTVVVRSVNSEEACRVLDVFYQISSEYRPGSNVTPFVAYLKTRPIGYVELIRRDSTNGDQSGYWMFSLYVRYRYRGLGIGEQLCQEVIQKATTEGATKLSLLVKVENNTAQSLYRKLGFQIVTDDQESKWLNYGYDPAFPLVAMQKQLR